MQHLDYRVIDAFAAGRFTGNPAAVVMLANWPDETWLQNVAMEMNLAETAFLVRSAEQTDTYDLRWFTPKVEVDLCGHATLAAAAALADTGLMSESATIRFSTRSGILTVERRSGEYQLNFPVVPAAICSPPAGLIESLGVKPIHVAKNQFDYLVEVASVLEVRQASPSYAQLALIQARGVILTAHDPSSEYEFVSRFFAPACGIDEDPVTGSAHCCLAHYWSARLGKSRMVGYQASPRGGIVRVELIDDRVLLSGFARIFARGQLSELG